MKRKLLSILIITMLSAVNIPAQSNKKQAKCSITCKVHHLAEWQQNRNRQNFSDVTFNKNGSIEIHSNDDFTLIQQTSYNNTQHLSRQFNTNDISKTCIITDDCSISWYRHFALHNPYHAQNIAAKTKPHFIPAVMKKKIPSPNPSNKTTIYTICWNSKD